MPRVDLSDYELAHDLLPPVCAKCGEPATDRPTHKLYIADGWSGAVQVFGLISGLFLFPPLMLFTLRFARLLEVRSPPVPGPPGRTRAPRAGGEALPLSRVDRGDGPHGAGGDR